MGADVINAYKSIQFLIDLQMPRFGSSAEKMKVINDVAVRCRISMRTRPSLIEGSISKARILITGAVGDAEALSVCEVVEEMIQQKLQVLCSVIRTEEEARSSIPYASYVVVVLSRGLLREPHFAMIMLESYLQFKGWGGSTPGGSRSRSMTLRGSDRGTEFVTVTADTRFEFPSMDFYHEIATSGLGMGEEVGRKLEKIYRSLLQMLALPLTPHGSKGLIEKQIHEICAKFPRYKDGMKGLEMDERADLLVDAAEAADGNASDVSASMDFGFARIISGGYQSGQGSAGYLGHILEGSDSIVSVENEHAAWVSVKEDESQEGECEQEISQYF
ncbi:unnamed protein product [Durusdinium trenchii]|uniref:Uncharacterized protein n=1 Tax=Durusdinium trenchii TaxID=1381693 RepID=A0ABP0IIU9_9DINO